MSYKGEFDKRGFDTMFAFSQMDNRKPNIPILKKSIQDLMQMMTQKTSGRGKNDIDWEENFDMTVITILLESIPLYLNGDLEKLERLERAKQRAKGNLVKFDQIKKDKK